MKAILAAAAFAVMGSQAHAATVYSDWTNAYSKGAGTITIASYDGWETVRFHLRTRTKIINIFGGFAPSPDYEIVNEYIVSSPGSNVFTWSVPFGSDLVHLLSGRVELSACWFGNERCNTAGFFLSPDEIAAGRAQVTVWETPSVPVPAAAPLLLGALGLLALGKRRRTRSR